jgi:hypothetical protein
MFAHVAPDSMGSRLIQKSLLNTVELASVDIGAFISFFWFLYVLENSLYYIKCLQIFLLSQIFLG